jgi:hypothetical protein
MSREHEMVFETDGRHSNVYLYEPPMGVRQYVEPIDEVLDLGFDTISYVVGDCSVLLYDTKVGERWGHNVDLCDHAIWYRAGINTASMIERGQDPLRIVCDHAHHRGFQFVPQLLLNLSHTPHGRVTNSRVADFTTEHPEWRIGEESDAPEEMRPNPNQLSYAVSEVRENRLAVIRELVCDYPADGIELNFFIHCPLIARSDVDEHTSTMTEWVRQIRGICDTAAKDQNRPKRVIARIGATVEGNKAMGYDIETWINEGLVDTLIAMSVGDGYEADNAGLRGVTEAAGTSVKVLAGLDSVAAEQPREVHRAAAANAYAAGAQGILIHRYYPGPERYPYNDEMTNRLRFLAYPDVLAHQDKIYRICPRQEPRDGIEFGILEQLPLPLNDPEEGKETHIDVADDVAVKDKLGELWKCELRIMLQHMVHTDVVRVYWNNVEVPDEMIRKADWTFQMRPRPTYARDGYRLHIELSRDRLPKVGRNTLRIEVVKKDEKLVQPITLSDVELSVEYLPHRHGLRPAEPYAGGKLFTP